MRQHIGDLENIESFGLFRDAVTSLGRILESERQVIAHRLHPNYFSTKWVLMQKGMRLMGVQHHHAHIAACGFAPKDLATAVTRRVCLVSRGATSLSERPWWSQEFVWRTDSTALVGPPDVPVQRSRYGINAIPTSVGSQNEKRRYARTTTTAVGLGAPNKA